MVFRDDNSEFLIRILTDCLELFLNFRINYLNFSTMNKTTVPQKAITEELVDKADIPAVV